MRYERREPNPQCGGTAGRLALRWASLSFYAAVGFTIRFRRTAPEFVYIELGDVQLLLEQEHT